MHVRGLAHVQRGQVEAEDFGGAQQRRQPRPDQRGAVVGGQRVGDARLQVGVNSIALAIRFGVADFACAGRGRAQRARAGGQPRVDADQRAPVGLVAAMVDVSGEASASACSSG
jgi:hypothetical protein